MKKFTTLALIASGLVILTMTACEKRIDYEAQELPVTMVINSIIEGGQHAEFRITKSKSVLEGSYEFEPLTDCEITLKENGTVLGSTNVLDNGNYLIDLPIQHGSTYEVEIEHPQMGTSSASTYVPHVVSDLTALGVDTDDGLEITVQFTDLPDAEYYHILLVDEGFTQPNIQSWFSTSEYFESDVLDGEASYYSDGLFRDDLFSGGQAEIKISRNFYGYGYGSEELAVYVYSCSEDYFLYFKSREAFYNSSDGLFAQPVQIHDNIDSGFGIFAGFGKATADVTF